MPRPYRRGDAALTDKLIIKLHPNDKTALEDDAAARETSMAAIVRGLIERYLKRSYR